MEPNVGLSYIYYPYEGGSRQFTVTFPYLSPDHVRVRVGEGELSFAVPFTWVGPSVIEVSETDLPSNNSVLVHRVTPLGSLLVDFQDGAQLPADDLNKITRQLFYCLQEMTEYRGGAPIPAPGAPGSVGENVDDLVNAVLNNPALQALLVRMDATDMSAETLIEDLLRSDGFNDTNRVQDYKIDLVEVQSGENAAAILNAQAAIATETTARATAITALTAETQAGMAGILEELEVVATQTETNATAITVLNASTSAAFAGIEEEFTALATGTGEWSATYTLSIQGYTTGGTPVIGGIGLGVSPETGSEFFILADRFAVLHPTYTAGGAIATPIVPFIVGTINGAPTVGVNGQLVVDGSIRANSISVTSLSAITGNLGTINGGIFRTHVLDEDGEVIDPLEFRVEITNEPSDNWPLWVGEGVKNEDNAVFYVKRDGSAGFDGDVKAPNITGNLQQTVGVNYNTPIAVAGSTGSVNFTTVHSFTLPAPIKPGEEHIPAFTFTMKFDPCVQPILKVEWLNGSIWEEASSAEAPFVIADTTTNTNVNSSMNANTSLSLNSSFSGNVNVNAGGADFHNHSASVNGTVNTTGTASTTGTVTSNAISNSITIASTYTNTLTCSGALSPTASATQFRIRLAHNGFYAGGTSARYVRGYAFGIR